MRARSHVKNGRDDKSGEDMRAATFAPRGAVKAARRSVNGMRRTRITIAALTALLMLGKPGVGWAISLEDAVQLAVRTHPTVLGAKNLQTAADARIREARAGFRSSLDLRVAGGFAATNNAATRARLGRLPADPQSDDFTRGESALLFVQPLFDGFDSRSRTRAAVARLEAAENRILDAGEVIGLRATISYLNVIRTRELVDLSETNVERHTDIVERIRVQVEGGGGSAADLDQAAGRLALATSTFLQLRGNARQAEAAYLEVIGELPDTLVLPLDPELPIPENQSEAVVIAIDTNPVLLAAGEDTRARRQDVQTARAPFFPQLDLELEGSRNQSIGGVEGPSNEGRAMLVLNFNIFRGGAKAARFDAARAQLAEARQRTAEIRRVVEQNVRNSYAALTTSRERIPILEGYVDSSERALDAYTEQFTLGRRTLLDVLNVENEVFGAQASLLNEQVNELQSRYQILASIGRLLNTLQIAVGSIQSESE